MLIYDMSYQNANSHLNIVLSPGNVVNVDQVRDMKKPKEDVTRPALNSRINRLLIYAESPKNL